MPKILWNFPIRYVLSISGIILFIAGLTTPLFSQDIHLSQFFNTPLLRNPALAGVFNGDIRIQAVYRNQWQSIGFPYQTNALSGEYKFNVGSGDDFMTVGASAFYDEAGVQKLKTLQVMPALNFHKSLSGNRNSYLSAGFMAGFVNRQFDGKNLTFDNQYTGGRFDASNPSGENFTGLSRGFLDVALGLSYNSDFGEKGSYYIGGSLWHFNKPSYSFLSDNIQLDPKWQFNAGLRTWLNEQVRLTFEGNYLKQGVYSETIAGGLVQYFFDDAIMSDNPISELSVAGGVFVRFQDAIIPYAQISYNHFDVGISYDVNTSPLKAASQGRGGFELSLTYRGFTQGGGSTIGSLRCPRF